MMSIKIRLAALIAALLLTPALALAGEEFDGNVVAGDTVAVAAPYGGTVASISLTEGALIAVGDPVATMQTTRVLAPVDGTVRGVFHQAGDALSGDAVLTIAPVSKYTITCTLDKAYDSIDTNYVRIGETVYLKCKPDGSHKAVGTVTAVNGSQYTVQTTAGELYMEETVYVYRSDAYTKVTRIGSGTVGRTSELSVTGTGSLLKLYVSDGDTVERGQLLYETVTGTLDGLGVYTDTVQSDAAGVIASVKVAAGQQVAKGDVLLTVYQPQNYRISFPVDEDLLGSVHVGDQVVITLNWNEDTGKTYQGTVTGISYLSDALADASSQSATGTTATTTTKTQYTGTVAFTADDDVRVGMSVTLTTVDE